MFTANRYPINNTSHRYTDTVKQLTHCYLDQPAKGMSARIGLVLKAAVLLGLSMINGAYASPEAHSLRLQNSLERQQAEQTKAISEEDLKVLQFAPNNKDRIVFSPAKAPTNIESPKAVAATLAPDGSLTRSQLIKVRKDNAVATAQEDFANPVYYEFDFFDASVQLYEDKDYDGFFQTFGVSFDADVFTTAGVGRAEVYADLYLSQDGGPWFHYYTTEIFTIVGDSLLDDYEVITTLEAGYDMDHYDVLIDLYEVGFADVVATISSDQHNALYALPLESREYDEYVAPVYEEVVIETEVHAGGSMSVLMLLGLGLLFVWRRLH